jgi:FtsP/CotA-like multicopper oxidase with cupredoxin domain
VVAVVAAAIFVASFLVGRAWWESRIPGTYSVMQFGFPDYGGGPPASKHMRAMGQMHMQMAGGIDPRASVTELVDRSSGPPDARFTLVAEHARIRLASGATVDALTFNGRVPGPELRVHTGDLVEVTLENRDLKEGVTIHWHGLDVPNAEDGVAGVTQNDVRVGDRYVYRFRVNQTGTFWYHTHQESDDGVRRGLYGAIVVEPKTSPAEKALDLTLIAHSLNGKRVLNAHDQPGHRVVGAGTPVRLRLVNSNNTTERFALSGTPFRVVAIDGTDLHGPTTISQHLIAVPGGGRYDVAFTMPARPVWVQLVRGDAALGLGTTSGAPPGGSFGKWPDFDPLGYGTPAPTPFGARSHFDRQFMLKIQRRLGFENGRLGLQWAVNGHIYPAVPMFMVRRGELVKFTIVNDTGAVHPMHLHGHHMLVLSRNGVPDRGSPWWSDTLGVEPHEQYEVAFRADNPGLWMDHCHNLRHAVAGLTMHVAYENVTTPFVIGGAAHNVPE